MHETSHSTGRRVPGYGQCRGRQGALAWPHRVGCSHGDTTSVLAGGGAAAPMQTAAMRILERQWEIRMPNADAGLFHHVVAQRRNETSRGRCQLNRAGRPLISKRLWVRCSAPVKCICGGPQSILQLRDGASDSSEAPPASPFASQFHRVKLAGEWGWALEACSVHWLPVSQCQ